MNKEKKHIHAWVISLIAIVFVLIIGYIAKLQIDKYEHGIMDIYAIQQDGYVQLVLDQINLVSDRADEEVVNNILQTLDASSNKYWTMSKQGTLIFVKDIQETNKYKGFTTETYFISDSARKFINGLQTNRVTHSIITINEREYVASGVQYEYNGSDYRICLLTAEAIALNNNEYMSAKINLEMLLIIVFISLVISSVLLAIIAERWYRRYRREQDITSELRITVEKLNERMMRKELYDPRCMVFRDNALSQILNKIQERDVWPVSYIVLKGSSRDACDDFLNTSQAVFDKGVIRVRLGEAHIGLIWLKCPRGAEAKNLKLLVSKDIQIAGGIHFEEKPSKDMEETIREYNTRVMSEKKGE